MRLARHREVFDAACTPFNAHLCLVRRIRLPLRNAMQPASCENSFDDVSFAVGRQPCRAGATA